MVDNELQALGRNSGEEAIRANQCAQREVGFQRGSWRSDADHIALAQNGAESFQGLDSLLRLCRSSSGWRIRRLLSTNS